MEVAQHYNNNDSGSEHESSSDLTENLSSPTKKSMHQQFLDYQQNSSIGGGGNSLTGNGSSGPGNGSGMPEFAAAAAAAAAAMAAAKGRKDSPTCSWCVSERRRRVHIWYCVQGGGDRQHDAGVQREDAR